MAMYILEGNIGAGKSTLLKRIKETDSDVGVIFEPVNTWHNQRTGQSLLGSFYRDIPRWAFSLETYAMACRVKEHLREQKELDPYRIMERSIYSGHYCFAHNSYQSGGMSDIEWSIYKQWFTFLVHGQCRLPFGFIYLKTDPDVCFERVKRRARSGEQNITLKYLKQIDKMHDHFLLDKEGVIPELEMIPVLILDGNKPFDTCDNLFNEYCDQIEEFMHKTHIPVVAREHQITL
jgi:deoxyadenosine/deoxycytidine kinase